MRSRTPKVLHDLCGRPMIAWPVAAALAAGAGQGRRRRRARSGRSTGQLPDGVELAVQPEPNGTGGAVQAAAAHLGDEPVLVLNGDVPLVTAEALAALIEAHAAAGGAGDGRLDGARRPDGLRARRAPRATGRSSAWWRPRSKATRPPSELAIREVNAGVYAFDGAALKDALERLTPDNAQGELYLPVDARAARPRRARHRARRPDAAARRQRPRRPGARAGARPGPHPSRSTCAPGSRSSIRPAR